MASRESRLALQPRGMDRRPRPGEEYRNPNPKPVSTVSTFRKYIKNPFKSKISHDNKSSRRQGTFVDSYQSLPSGSNYNSNFTNSRIPNNFVGPPTYKTQEPQPFQSLALRRTSLHRGWDR